MMLTNVISKFSSSLMQKILVTQSSSGIFHYKSLSITRSYSIDASSSLSENDNYSVEYPNFSFDILPEDYQRNEENSQINKARRGIITTPHGKVETPNFVFCATKAVSCNNHVLENLITSHH